MIDMQKNISRKTRAFVMMAVAAVSLTACASENSAERTNYLETHPIKVAREQVSITIALPEENRNLNAEDARRFKGFLRDYVQRGRTQVNVETALPGVARSVLTANGFKTEELLFIDSATVPAPNVILSFTANKALVPQCGDFSENMAFNPENMHSKNFGCATRRNLGLIVADPGDLIQSQPQSSGSAARSDITIDSYKAGTAPAAAAAAAE